MPKELISRFVKLCPTCRERRGAAFPADEENIPPNPTTTNAESVSGDVRSPLKRRRSEATSDNETAGVMNLPSQLKNSSPAFRAQNRWLSGLPHQSTFDENFTPAPPYSTHASFTEMESTSSTSQPQYLARKDTSQDIRSASGLSPPLKQGPQYKYE